MRLLKNLLAPFTLVTKKGGIESLARSKQIPGHIKRLGAEKFCYVLARDNPLSTLQEKSLFATDKAKNSHDFQHYINEQWRAAMSQALYLDITKLNGFSEHSLTSFTLLLYHLRCFKTPSIKQPIPPLYFPQDVPDMGDFPAYIKTRKESLPMLTKIFVNLKKLYPDSQSPCILIEDEADGIEKMNVLDFFQLGRELDAELLAEQLSRNDLELPQSTVYSAPPDVLTIPGLRLSHVLKRYCTVLEWEKIFQKYPNATVFVGSGRENDVKTVQMATFCSEITFPIVIQCCLPKERKEVEKKTPKEPSNPYHFNWLSLSALDLQQICQLYTRDPMYYDAAVIRASVLDPSEISDMAERKAGSAGRCDLAAHLYQLFQGKKVKAEDLEFYSKLLNSYFQTEISSYTEADYEALESCVETIELTYRKHYTLVQLFSDMMEHLDEFKKAQLQNLVDNVLRKQSVRLGVNDRLPDHTIVSGDVTFKRTLISQRGNLHQHGVIEMPFTFMYMIKWKILPSDALNLEHS